MSVNSVYMFLCNNLGNNNGWFSLNDVIKGCGLSKTSVFNSIRRLKIRDDLYIKDIRKEELGVPLSIEDGSYIFYKVKRK